MTPSLANAITWGFVGVIAVYAVTHAFLLKYFLGKSWKEVRSALRAAKAGRPIEGGLLGELWTGYSSTLMSPSGERAKTDVHAAEYFGEVRVLAGRLSLRYWLAIPNLLVGLGILGTFVGLAYGIDGFDTATSEQIRTGINGLLAGMSTAFFSSIVGMFASIVFGVWEKGQFRRLTKALHELSRELDRRYLITTADRLAFAREDQIELLSELFGYKTGDGPVRPGDAIQAIRWEAEQQTTALKQFSTDLADGINLSNMTIEALGVNLSKAFDDAMRTTLAPTLNGVKSAVEQLQQEKSASNEAMVEDVVGHLQEALEKMGAQFQHALSGGALSQLESVAASIGEAHGALSSLPATVQALMDEMRSTLAQSNGRMVEEVAATSGRIRGETEEAIGKLGQAIEAMQANTQSLIVSQGETVQALMQDVRSSLAQSSSKMAEDAAATSHHLRNQAEQTLGQFGQTVNSLQSNTQSLLGQQNETARAIMDWMREAIAENSRRMSEDVAATSGVLRTETERAVGEFGQAIGELQSRTKSLLEQQGETTESATQLTENVRQLIEGADHAARQLRKAAEEVDDTLDGIDELGEALTSSSAALNESSKALRETTLVFATNSKAWLQGNQSALESLRNALGESSRVGADYAEKFGVIEKGLQGIFGEIQNGLGGYQSTTRESLNRYLNEFTDQLSTAANALSGSVSALDESLGELVDAVESSGRSSSNGLRRS